MQGIFEQSQPSCQFNAFIKEIRLYAANLHFERSLFSDNYKYQAFSSWVKEVFDG